MAGMYSERLVVRNFGPITNLDIEFRRLTLFIGDQGSGKSTLSKLLTIKLPDGMTRDLRLPTLHGVRSIRKNRFSRKLRTARNSFLTVKRFSLPLKMRRFRPVPGCAGG